MGEPGFRIKEFGIEQGDEMCPIMYRTGFKLADQVYAWFVRDLVNPLRQRSMSRERQPIDSRKRKRALGVATLAVILLEFRHFVV